MPKYLRNLAADIVSDSLPLPGSVAPFEFGQDALKSFLSFSEIIDSAVVALDGERRPADTTGPLPGCLTKATGCG